MTHLTEEQIDELLMGSHEPAEAARMRDHAAVCEACAAKLAEVEAPIASFNAVSLAWSERRSATLPVRPSTRRSGARLGLGFAWGSVAAAVLLAAAVPVLRHEQNIHVQQAYRNAANIQSAGQPTTPAPAATTTLASPASSANDDTVAVVPENAQEIASDNRMLAMVDEELNAPLPSLRSATQGRGRAQRNTQTTVQD